MSLLTQPAVCTSTLDARVDQEMLARVLAPYKPHCQYLQTAVVEYGPTPHSIAAASGRFSIPESCYIASTGHFNAVEFNICYNQLTYCLLAKIIADGALESLARWTLKEFSRRQLADFLIARFSSCFHKPLTAGTFDGRVDVVKIAARRDAIFMKTICRFDDDHGGHADGEATIAIIDSRQQ
jgi:FcoT-like thioesterase domain